MKNLQHALGLICTLAASQASALVTFAPGASYSVGIPSSSTISQSAAGGIYFQLSAPTTYQWVGLGIGSQMAGASIFVMYADGKGNVTISARSGGQGEVEPQQSPSLQSGVTLLAGSGIVNGKMIANVHCTTCKLSSSKTSTSSPWICASRQGAALNSASTSATITQHDVNSMFQVKLDLTSAAMSTDANPFVSSSTSGSSSTTSSGSSPTSTSSSGGDDNGSGDDDGGSGSGGVTIVGTDGKVLTDYQTAHGVIMGATVVLLVPLGAMLMRFGASMYLHGAWQIFALCSMLCGFGVGIKLAQMSFQLYKGEARTHTIFGTVIVGLFLLQPIFGLLHHLQYRRTSTRAPVSHLHIWFGRAIMICGIVNGGLGLKLAGNSKGGMIGYGVVAGVVGLAYILLVVVKRKNGTKEVIRERRRGEKSGGVIRE